MTASPPSLKISHSNFVAIALLSWTAYSGLLSMPLWVGALSSNENLSASLGYIASAQLAFAAIAGLIYTAFITRMNPRLVSVFALALLGVSNFASIYAGDANSFALARCGSGISEGLLLANLNVIIGRMNQPDRLFAFSQTSVAVFGILFFFCVPRLIPELGSAVIFATIVLIAVLALVSLLGLKFDEASETSVNSAQTAQDKKPLSAMIMLVGLGFIFVGSQAVWAFMGRMGAHKGFDLTSIGNILVIGQFVSLLGPVASVWVAGKIGRAQTVILGVGVYILVTALAAYDLPSDMFRVSGTFFQFGTLFVVTSVFGYLATLDLSGRAIAAAPTAINIGSAVGPGLAGWIILQKGFPEMGSVMIIIFAVGCLCTLIAHRKTASA